MNFLLRECRIVSDNKVRDGDIRVRDGKIADIAPALAAAAGEKIIEGGGRLLFPGLIDDQVHFRQPGLTHKADIASESAAAAAGGVTSFMDMPNVIPPTLSMQHIEEKRTIAAAHARVNYAFYLGASINNIDDIRTADATRIAGVKIFMGSSTGNMLVDDESVLRQIFSASPTLIATHCESTPRVNQRLAAAKEKYGDDIPATEHPNIRDADACFASSSRAIALARETGARLHILHISTAKELSLFTTGNATDKQITSEACAHHLLFDERDYASLGMRLKTNPAVKNITDQAAIREAVASGRIDVLATDHAPHLLEEKELPYTKAAAGMPLIEYALPAFLQLVTEGVLSYPQIATRGAHTVADIFAIKERGYIREGYWADFVLVENAPDGVLPRKDILSKCGWTPFTGRKFSHAIAATFINGECVWQDGKINDTVRGMALEFAR
ncbi:MAG: dihydroorotase [Gammaproteobacteria bacterium WSBS_2016_MAG_OTU1]